MRSRPSVVEVATLARVSVGTVSNVLNRPDHVAPGTRSRVEAAIAELGFVPSTSARQLRGGAARSIAVVVDDVARPGIAPMLRGVEDRLRDEGLTLMVSSSDGDAARRSHLLRVFEQHRVGGVLVATAGGDLSELTTLRDRGTGVVLLDDEADGTFATVSVDEVCGGRLAVAHLLREGRRRISVLGGPAGASRFDDRLAGARLAVVDAGLDPALVLAEAVLPVVDADAILCTDGPVTIEALRTLLRAGVDVPGDTAVVGYVDDDLASALPVPLTTIRRPARRLGWAAADLLLRPATAGPTHVRLEPELVVRASTAATA